MAPVCGACGAAPRRDESLSLAEAPAGMVHVCRACRGDAAPPARYPVGRLAPVPVCGLCRLALRADEPAGGVPARLAPEDLDGDEAGGPGHYRLCRECLAKYRPRVARRLRDLGLLPEGAPDAAAAGDLLL